MEQRWTPVLDAAFRETGYVVRPATIEEQWRGMDRIITDEFGAEHRVEYKCCEKARDTRNLFLEVMSNAQTGRRGCVLTSEADWFLYFATPDRVFVFWLERLRETMTSWRRRFREARSENVGYDTVGILVPISVAEPIAEYVARVDRGDALILQTPER